MNLPSSFKIVSASAGCLTTNGAVTFDSVSLKNVHKAWIVCHFTQAATDATIITPKVGATVATATTAITFSAEWWKNVDISDTDTLVVQTAATTMAVDAGTDDQLIVIEIDPAAVKAQNATFDVLGGSVAASSEVTNFISAVYYLETRYQQATPPAAITD